MVKLDKTEKAEKFSKMQEVVADIKDPERANAAQELMEKIGVKVSRDSVKKNDQENTVQQEYERE